MVLSTCRTKKNKGSIYETVRSEGPVSIDGVVHTCLGSLSIGGDAGDNGEQEGIDLGSKGTVHTRGCMHRECR
jgi:hypothetical protein